MTIVDHYSLDHVREHFRSKGFAPWVDRLHARPTSLSLYRGGVLRMRFGLEVRGSARVVTRTHLMDVVSRFVRGGPPLDPVSGAALDTAMPPEMRRELGESA